MWPVIAPRQRRECVLSSGNWEIQHKNGRTMSICWNTIESKIRKNHNHKLRLNKKHKSIKVNFRNNFEDWLIWRSFRFFIGTIKWEWKGWGISHSTIANGIKNRFSSDKQIKNNYHEHPSGQLLIREKKSIQIEVSLQMDWYKKLGIKKKTREENRKKMISSTSNLLQLIYRYCVIFLDSCTIHIEWSELVKSH